MIDVESLGSFDPDGRAPIFERPYTVVLGLQAGESVPEHTHPGQDILFAVVDGSLTLTVGEQSRTLDAGDLARFDGDNGISVTADEDVRAVVVFGDR